MALFATKSRSSISNRNEREEKLLIAIKDAVVSDETKRFGSYSGGVV